MIIKNMIKKDLKKYKVKNIQINPNLKIQKLNSLFKILTPILNYMIQRTKKLKC